MMEWFNALITWVSANPTWAGVLVFLVAFSESLAIIGMIVPGVVMMFAAGALVGAGVVDFWPIYFAAFAGAVLGDALSFYLGARYREDLCNMWPFSKHTELLDQGVVYFKRWGGKSVAIGRFFGPVRAVIPLVAGMLQMQVGRYLVANILSAIGWAFAYLLPGIAIGASLELASQVAFHLVVLMLSLVAILWLSLWLLHRLFIWIQPLANCWLQLLLAFSEGDSLPRRIAAALADPQHPESKGLSIMAAFIFISVFALALLMTLVFGDTGFGVLDQYIHNATSALRYPTGDSIMVLITTLGDGWLLGWLSATVFILLFIQHRPTAWHWLAAVVFAFAAPWLLKAGLQVARPPNAALTNWSFPSGHAVHATVIYGFLAVLLATRLPQERRWLVYAVTIVLVLLIGFSRLYLGVHWFSDVIAGWVLGLLWISVLGLAWRHHPHPPLQEKAVISGVILVLVLTLFWYVNSSHEQRVADYRPLATVDSLTMDDWHAGVPLPMVRRTLTSIEQFTLRVAADPHTAASALESMGWRPTEATGATDFLRYLLTDAPGTELPPPPKVYKGQLPGVQMIRQVDDRRLIVRLWKTDTVLGDCPVYAGHMMQEKINDVLGLFVMIESQPVETPAVLESVKANLESLRCISRTEP
ncbi:hypothetical protein BOW28_07195 [Solemya velum gill symbiont]|uniref:bifunctional DedA family/phosphatase PAP2 family protein n=1 Tax=Solemya velum gill symbiont TaxID=2340 RepID=UPI0009962927|nr:bifunctional DedA family/phosphatase PAP2 family protein [Solemya velum gill symbiont]OOZ17227.1 hypothetical protein BOW28_07195 [Solemya velum gill symbiont]OOZ26787.1 hypothetical protein BOW32_06480 [Solemya velum gill symbiont]